MSCGCSKPSKSGAWSPVAEFRGASDIMRGENIDCYAKRASATGKDDVAEKPPNRIDNTSFTSDSNLTVNETFKLTSTSTKKATKWELKIDGTTDFATVFTTLTVTDGKVSGTVADSLKNKVYKVLVTAYDDSDDVIDAREFNFFPKKMVKGEFVKFYFPMPGGKINSAFGPRMHPIQNVMKMHTGVDIRSGIAGGASIVSAADGKVIFAGPNGGYGNCLKIEHRDASDNIVAYTLYAHCAQLYVQQGQQVSAMQKIALEGSTGASTGNHLHFEIHRGKMGNFTDPKPLLCGTFDIAGDSLPGKSGEGTNYSTVRNGGNAGLSSAEAAVGNDCPTVLPEQNNTSADVPATISTNFKNGSKDRSPCALPCPPTSAVISDMMRAFNEDSSLAEEEKRFLITMAKIESNLDPYAENKSSSAMGLFQMVDKTARFYYAKISAEPSCANRCDAYLASKAMVLFYKNELRSYWNEYTSSGQTKVARQMIKETDHSKRYPSLNKFEFIYMTHHDGVGSVASGRDREGLKIWRDRAPKMA